MAGAGERSAQKSQQPNASPHPASAGQPAISPAASVPGSPGQGMS